MYLHIYIFTYLYIYIYRSLDLHAITKTKDPRPRTSPLASRQDLAKTQDLATRLSPRPRQGLARTSPRPRQDLHLHPQPLRPVGGVGFLRELLVGRKSMKLEGSARGFGA